jgi:hypothetical protein
MKVQIKLLGIKTRNSQTGFLIIPTFLRLEASMENYH